MNHAVPSVSCPHLYIFLQSSLSPLSFSLSLSLFFNPFLSSSLCSLQSDPFTHTLSASNRRLRWRHRRSHRLSSLLFQSHPILTSQPSPTHFLFSVFLLFVKMFFMFCHFAHFNPTVFYFLFHSKPNPSSESF